MSEILTKINKKINFQKILKNEIENIESILTKNIHILNSFFKSTKEGIRDVVLHFHYKNKTKRKTQCFNFLNYLSHF